MSGNAVSAAAVAVPIVLILLAVAIAAIVVMGVLIFVYYKSKYTDNAYYKLLRDISMFFRT